MLLILILCGVVGFQECNANYRKIRKLFELYEKPFAWFTGTSSATGEKPKENLCNSDDLFHFTRVLDQVELLFVGFFSSLLEHLFNLLRELLNLLLDYKWIISGLQVDYMWITSVLQVYYKWITSGYSRSRVREHIRLNRHLLYTKYVYIYHNIASITQYDLIYSLIIDKLDTITTFIIEQYILSI